MALSTEEKKLLIELSAKAEGLSKKDFLLRAAKEEGIELPTAQAQRTDPNTRFLELLTKTSGEGKLNLKESMENMMNFKMMEMMLGGSMIGGKQPETPALNVLEIIEKNDEKWERRLEQLTQKTEREAEKAALQKQLDEMKALILTGGSGKKDEVSEKFEKLNEKLDAEKEKRFEIALDSKSNEIDQLKDFMQQSLDDIRNQAPPKSSDEGFFEMMQKMEKFDSMVRSRGKALGMTSEQIEREIAKEKPMKQQILSDIFKTLNRGIDAYAGRKPEPDSDQPEIAQPGAQSLTCGDCGKTSNNGSDWCDACRIRYSNDAVEAQRKAVEAAQNAPARQTEAEARAKGEIPVEAQQEEAQ